MPKVSTLVFGVLVMAFGDPLAVWGQQGFGCFSFATDSIGCVPLKIGFTNCYTPGQPVAYNFTFNLNPAASAFSTVGNATGDTSYTYSQPGRYDVRQVASGGIINKSFRRLVRVFPYNSKPTFTLTSCPGQVVVHLTDTLFRQCIVEVGIEKRTVDIGKDGATTAFSLNLSLATKIGVTVTGTSPSGCGNTSLTDSITIYPTFPPQLIQSAEGPTPSSLTISYPTLADVHYRLWLRPYKISGINLLKDTASKLTEIKTQTFTIQPSAKFVLLYEVGTGCPQVALDSLIALNPRPGPRPGTINFDSLDPYPATSGISTTGQPSVALGKADTTYTDTKPYRCNEQRCYTLKTATGGRFYTSYPVCQRNSSGASQSLRLVSSKWDPSENAHVFQFDSSLTVSEFKGPDIAFISTSPPKTALKGSACASIGYTDSCGNIQAADSSYCPFILSGSIQHDTRLLEHRLPSGVGLRGPFTLFLKVSSPDGQLLGTFPLGVGIYSDQGKYPFQRLIYQALALPVNHPKDTSTSNPVELVRQHEVILPEAFSPNGDGINDVLLAQTRFIAEATITIFDSWGSAVYKSGLPFEWAGNGPSGKVPAGQYLAVVRAKTQEGASFVQRSWVDVAP